jgi:GMP synthase (glutamine-hydrolysing)
MRMHVLRHVFFEDAASIETWARGTGFEVTETKLYAAETLPKVADIDWLLVMGGPMNIYEDDKYPWLPREKSFIAEAIGSGKIVIGVCLGAQLAADQLGGAVTKNAVPEIGWFPVRWTSEAVKDPVFAGLPAQTTVLHWHGDTFALPPEAVRLAESTACKNQAFRYGNNVFGLQFHLEATRESIALLVENCADELVPGPQVQSAEDIIAGGNRCAENQQLMTTILDRIQTMMASQ